MTTQPPPFLFELTSIRGRDAAQLPKDDDQNALCEWTTWLRVRSDVSGFVAPVTAPDDDDVTGFVPPAFENDGLAVLATTRSPRDLPGEPIGLFYRRLDIDELEDLRRAVEMTPWLELPVPAGGHYTAPRIAIRHSSSNCLIQREFNGSCANFIDAIAPLWERLHDLLARLKERPAAALAVEVSAERTSQNDSKQWDLGIKLMNFGMDPVVLTDPRLTHSVLAGCPRLELRVATLGAQPEGAPPEAWTEISLPPPPVECPPALVLAGRRRLEISVPWTAPGPGRYLLEGRWQDYQGPVERVPGQIAFMPLPKRGPSALGSGPYPVRGAAFATRVLEVPADKERRGR